MNIEEKLFDMQKVYHRAIFDCFNEGLSQIVFQPQLRLKDSLVPQKRHREHPMKNKLLVAAKEHVLDCASLLCGIIKDKEDSMMGNIRIMDSEFITQLREERMYRMITLEVIFL